MATAQTQAIAAANSLLNLGVAAYNLEGQITATIAQYNQLTMGATFSAMATCAVNTDGSLGLADGTASGSVGHVIDTRVSALSGLQRAISAADLATLVTLLTAVAQLLSGGAAPAQQGEAPQLLAKISGG